MNGTDLIDLISSPAALRPAPLPTTMKTTPGSRQPTWHAPDPKPAPTADAGRFAQIRMSQPMIAFPSFTRDSYAPDLKTASGALSRSSSIFDDRRNSQLRAAPGPGKQSASPPRSALAADEGRAVPLGKAPPPALPKSPLDAPPDAPDDARAAVQPRKRPPPPPPPAGAAPDADTPEPLRKPSAPLLPSVGTFDSEGDPEGAGDTPDAAEDRSIGLDAEAWVAYLTLSGLCVGEDVHATCRAAVGAVREHFPGAVPDQQLMGLVLRAMAARVPDFAPGATMLATSFCPDEIQNALGDLSHLLLEHFGKKFDFAGLGGLPFAGKTGFKVTPPPGPCQLAELQLVEMDWEQGPSQADTESMPSSHTSSRHTSPASRMSDDASTLSCSTMCSHCTTP